MTDWDALFKYLEDHTQAQAGKKFNIHPKSISRKKKEMNNRVTLEVTKVTLPKVTTPRRQFFRVPIVFLSDYKEVCHTWLSAYKSSKNGASIRRRERILNELERIKKEVDK